MLDKQIADEIYNRMIGLDRTPHSSIYLEIEPAQVRTILNSLVSEDETTNEMVELYKLTKHDGSSTKKIRMDYGEHGEPALTETDEQIAVRMIYDYISENVTDYKSEPVLLGDVLDWLDKESEGC